MEREKPLISVVVPVYNVAPYLERCLTSIQMQSWPNLEIIVVDDASTDGGGGICDSYAARDERIEVVHFFANQGLAAARNEGVCRAKGEFLTFVDSDDYVEPELLESLWSSLTESGAEISICGVDGFPEGHIKGGILSQEGIIHCMASRSPFLWNAWGKLFPTELVKRHPFDRRLLCVEDLAFFYQILEHTQRAGYVPEKLYHYVYREKSLINSPVDEKSCTVLYVLDHICPDACVRFPTSAVAFEQIALDAGVRLAMRVVEEGMGKQELRSYLKRFCDHTRRHFSWKALRLCPCKRGVVAQAALCVSWRAFLGIAILYRLFKTGKKKYVSAI